MPEIMYDPEQAKIEVLRDSVGGLEYRPDDAKQHVRKCCRIVRGICAKRGIKEDSVPCIHRPTNRFRYWDIRQGRPGGSHKCVLMLSPEWRLASEEEVKAQHRKWEDERKKAREDSEKLAAKKLALEAVAVSAIHAAQDSNHELTPDASKEQKPKDAKPKG